MNVYKSNLFENISEILNDIEKCSFIGFDGEFTGLATEKTVLPFDTPEEYYLKTVKITDGFIMIQLGLSFYHIENIEAENIEKQKVKCRSYNIYMYPQQKHSSFLSQGDCLKFLATNNFDFNKLFTNGVSYCNEFEEEQLQKTMNEKQEFRLIQMRQRIADVPIDESRVFIEVPEAEKELIQNAKLDVEKLLKKEINEIVFEKLNGFQRKLIYEMIDEHYYNKVSTSSRPIENNRKALVIEIKRTVEEELALEDELQLLQEQKFNESVGVRLILKEISKSKKLIVGHNCLLDLLYIIKQCFEPVPSNYCDFKKVVHKIFPNIIDTKFIGSSAVFKDIFSTTVLGNLYERMCSDPFQKIEIENTNSAYDYNLDSPKEHEAGYDAFLTGYCFMSMMKYLKIDLSIKELPKCPKLMPYLNRIALQYIQLPYIHITGKEPSQLRDHVFHIKFPATWQTTDIQNQFKNYGPINVSWVNNTNAFVSLYNRENSSCVEKTINKPFGFEVQSYSRFLLHQNKVVNQTRKRPVSESSEEQSVPKKVLCTGNKLKKNFTDHDNW